MKFCKVCGEENCDKHGFILGKTVTLKEFSGASPPEIFVGKWNYPNVYAGILSPQQYGHTEIFSAHEIWQAKKLPIPNIMELRNELIYGRTTTNIKNGIYHIPIVKSPKNGTWIELNPNLK